MAVQANCDLADALHAREASLCNYLLGLRELYRWESEIADCVVPDRASVIAWIGQRETLWETLLDDDERNYGPLPIGVGIEPFDEAGIDAALVDRGLVYGAGLKRFGHPEFVLAERIGSRRIEDLVIDFAGREYARGANPPMAAYRHGRVLVRTDIVRRWLANRLEVSDATNTSDPVSRAVTACLCNDDSLSSRVSALLPAMIELLVRHETGEHEAARLLGRDWELLLDDIAERRRELVVRAVRDLLADSLVTLPWLLDEAPPAALHLWWSSFDGMRRQLAPEFAAAYGRAIEGDPSPLAAQVSRSAPRWLEYAQSLLVAWRDHDVARLDQFTAFAEIGA